MKIGVILIVNLGLVACIDLQPSLPCARCQALEELQAFFFKANADTNGTKFSGMLEQYLQHGLILPDQKNELEKKIADYAQKKQLEDLVIETQNDITKEFCFCNDEVKRFCEKPVGLNNTERVIVITPPPLNGSFSEFGLNATEGNVTDYTCLICNAIRKLDNYVKSGIGDPDGIFWNLLDQITEEDAITEKERTAFGRVLRINNIRRCREMNYDKAAYQVIDYLLTKNPSRCCQKVGSNASASFFDCSVGLSEEKKAVHTLKAYINQDYHCDKILLSMTVTFYVQELISFEQWAVYQKLYKDGEQEKKIAQVILKDVIFNNAFIRLEDYEQKVKDNPKHDPQGTKIFELLAELENQDVMTGNQVIQCQNAWKGVQINQDPEKLVVFVRNILKSNLRP